jgi:radical SAM superfamily enzyme YgiQ (UPF0313 family)
MDLQNARAEWEAATLSIREGAGSAPIKYWHPIGGLHPTSLPDEAARHADTVFIGPGEDTWPSFLSRRSLHVDGPHAPRTAADPP